MGRSNGRYNSTRSTHYKIPHLLLGLAAIVALAGCKDDGKDSANCAKPINKVVSAQVKGSGDLYFNIDDLDFLSSQALVWNTVELNVVLQQNHTKDGDMDLDFNGLKCSKKDGSKSVDDSRYDNDSDDTKVNYKIHNMVLNGAVPFDLFLRNIKLNKGQLRISLHGKDTHIKSASITFNGVDHSACTAATTTTIANSPPPTTTTSTTVPPAIAHAKIDSATPSAALTASTSISIAFSSDITGSSFQCSLDGSAATSCSSPIAYSSVGNGSHNFSVIAYNSVGQAGPAASYSWSVDSVAPSATITNRSTLPTATNSTSISFQFSASEAGSTFTCSIDGNVGTDCTSPASFSGLAQGGHSFTVSAVDALGNNGGAADSYQWTIDTTAPVATINNVTPGEAVSNITNRTFTFSANESASFECSIDNGSYAACTSPMSLTNLADGSHWFAVRATDLVGNVGLAASSAWAIDTVAPVISLGAISPTAGLSNSKNISVEFATNEPATTTCDFDGVAAACTSPFTAAGVTDGSHTLTIHAVDAAGNVGTDQSVSWTIDATAPVISFGQILPSGSSYINSNSASLEVNSSESSTLTVTVNGSVIDQSSSPIQLGGLTDGSYTVSVTAVDTSGNASNTITHNFIVDTVAPTVSITAADQKPITKSDQNSFTLVSSEDGIFECQLNDAGFSECLSPVNYSGLADGRHVFQVRAVDLAGNVSTVSQYSWIVDTAPAIATSLTDAPATMTNLNTASFGFTANRSTSGYLCSLDGGAAVPCASPMTYSGLVDGNHTFKVQGIDIYGTVDQTGANYSWTIDRTAPTFTSLTTSTTRTSITVTWTTNEPATSKVNYGIGGLSTSTGDDGVYTTNHSVTIPASANTIYAVQAAGHDRAGNNSVSNTLSVRTPR